MKYRKVRFLILGLTVIAINFMLIIDAKATTILYTDEATWLSQTSTGFAQSFSITSTTVALADEVLLPPADNTLLGPSLTFQSGNTGLPFDFTFQDESPDPGTQVIFINGTLGSAPTRHHDWSVNFTGGLPVFEIGLDLAGGIDPSVFRVFDTANTQVASITGIPSFLGIISDDPIGRVLFDDTPTSGGMGLDGFKIPTPVPVPKPSTLLLFGFGLIGLAGLGERSYLKRVKKLRS